MNGQFTPETIENMFKDFQLGSESERNRFKELEFIGQVMPANSSEDQYSIVLSHNIKDEYHAKLAPVK